MPSQPTPEILVRAPLIIAAATAALSASLAISALIGSASAQAAGGGVVVQNTSFSPQTLTVPAGATVTWTNADQVAHTVTADDGSFDSGFFADGQTVSQIFATPGTYAYYCIPHGAPGGSGMAGLIVVQ
jgi:plastocyanin